MRSRRSRTPSRASGRPRVSGRPVRPGARIARPSAQAGALAAVLAGLLWSIGAIDLNAPSAQRFAMLLTGLALLLVCVRGLPVGALACAYAVCIGSIERISREPLEVGSDVLPATAEALDVMLRGQNPYTHVLQSTIPTGSPFVYPPGELFYYLGPHLLGMDLHRVETFAGILTILAIAVAGARAGWAQAALPAMLYATWGIAAFRTTDGGNDVSAALLVVTGFVAMAFPGRVAFVISAVALGWALAFKQFAVLVLPLALRHLAVAGADWRRYALVSLGTATVMTLPFFLMDPLAFVRQQILAVTFHEDVWGTNLLNALATAGRDVEGLLPLFFLLEIGLTVVALAFALRARLATIGEAAIAAALCVFVPLLLARWTTQSYYVYAVTLALAGVATLRVRASDYRGDEVVLTAPGTGSGGAGVTPPSGDPNRRNHTWLSAFRLTDGVPVADRVTREGQPVWYRFAIAPQTRVEVRVTDCTFDCNVVLYRDLYQVAATLRAAADTTGGVRANLAGNIAADDMDADDMDADDMDADDMDADDMDADDMDADDMDADDMDADDMDADDMDADDMDADDMDADDMDADGNPLSSYGPVYVSAQRRGIRAASLSEGLAPETIAIDTRSLTGDVFIRVKGDSLGDLGSFTIVARRTPDTSCRGAALVARQPSTAPAPLPAVTRSLILTDTTAFPAAERATLLARLGQLAAHPTVDGHVFDLATDRGIALLRGDWLAARSCVAQANLLTDAVRELVLRFRAAAPQLEHLIIAGGDDAVPFRREPDWAEISRESRYRPPVGGATASEASLLANMFLTDDFYVAATPIERVGRTLYVPDMAVGRLVESVADIAAYVDMYVAQDGRASPRRALSSGYDFALDLAQHVTAELTARGLDVDSSLARDAWTAADWRGTVLGAPVSRRFGILSLQGHFSANRLVPADNGQRVLSTEIAAVSDGRFDGALVYSLGCHSGYSIVNADAIPGLTQPLAFPEAFLRQGATLVGGTGYQYGETILIKNTEALLALFTTELGYTADPAGAPYGAAGVPVGKALLHAKRAYLGATATVRGIDFKVLGVSTLFGSPTMSFLLPLPAPRPTRQASLEPAVLTRDLGVVDATPSFTLARRSGGDAPAYYESGATTTAPYRPIAPLVVVPAQAATGVLGGVVFMGGSYTEQPFVPQLSVPAVDVGGRAPRYLNDAFAPVRPVRANLFDGDAVHLIPFQYRSDAEGTAGTARVYSSVRFRAYYSGATGERALVDAPVVERVEVGTGRTGDIEVRAVLRGNEAVGIVEVWTTYTDAAAPAGSWSSVAMTGGAEVSDERGFGGFAREFVATIPTGEAAAMRFMIQAVSGTGRVAVAANGGRLFGPPPPDAEPAPTAPLPTKLAVSGSPAAVAYRSRLTATATLGGLPDRRLGGQRIAFTFGGSRLFAVTGGDGVAAATFRVRATPGTHVLAARYAGADGVLGSAAAAEIEVRQAEASFAVSPATLRPPDGAVIARLVAEGVPLGDRPIVLRAGDRAVAATTGVAGVVRFETLDFPGAAGALEVTVEYPGDRRHLPASATVAVTVHDERKGEP